MTVLNNMNMGVTISGDLAQASRKCEVTLSNTTDSEHRKIYFKLGRRIRIVMDKTELFQGIIFGYEINDNGETAITAYDANHYLTKNSDSLRFDNKKASDIVKYICKRYGIKTGKITDTRYVIPKLILRDKTLWDIIVIALTETFKKNGKQFTLQSRGGYLHLVERREQLTRMYIEDGKNLLGATYSSNIDDTKTQVHLTGGDEEKPISAFAVDTEAKNVYGIMQHYEHVSEVTDTKKLQALAKSMLPKINKPEQEFNIEALGIPQVISGSSILVRESMTGISGAFYVVTDTHNFQPDGYHTMSLTLSRTFDVPVEEYDPPEEKKAESNDGSSNGSTTTTTTTIKGGRAKVPQIVRKWEPMVRKYARINGIESYTELLLAFMMQESGGRYPDLMQSSESLGLGRNVLRYEASIKQGVKYFANTLRKSKGDVKLALQAYNFGEGFIPWALARGGYSMANAKAFSAMMAKKHGWRRYGDVNYVPHVLRYYEGSTTTVTTTTKSSSSSSGRSLFIKPCEGVITSEMKRRWGRMHEGIDIAKAGTVPIKAAASGTVSKSYVSASYGEVIFIVHNINGQVYETVYGHMRKGSRRFKVGDKVSQGTQIGLMGNTGRSTGQHLHFEVHKGRWKNPVDPTGYIGKPGYVLLEDGTWGPPWKK
ncbi:XkdQ/YqbQ family protein [Priestia megaterium]|uniref:XkdQ/YqbQ family protein n=1 Tax=Priestia megaterium TaxID=1404 RepID=UPI00211D6F70|nr:lysozyme family protein [Priestia megaterium]